jgi:redox-sensing transcriptional repressor
MNKDDTHAGNHDEPKLSRATAGRLSLYLRRLQSLHAAGSATISSSQLGETLGITDAQVRKDLAYLGHLGYPGIGYYPQELITKIRGTLGLDRSWNVVLVGAGNLARALLRYRGFREQGFHVAAVFDIDPTKIGQRLEDVVIEPIERLAELVAATKAQLGVITVPADAAQAVADSLVAAGSKGILNFAPVVLRVPPHVSLVAVDLTIQLEQLAFLVQSETLCE